MKNLDNVSNLSPRFKNKNQAIRYNRDGVDAVADKADAKGRSIELRGQEPWRDESRWKGRKHEAGMTSLGLTFHSQPTPALCILTSLRYIPRLSLFPV